MEANLAVLKNMRSELRRYDKESSNTNLALKGAGLRKGAPSGNRVTVICSFPYAALVPPSEYTAEAMREATRADRKVKLGHSISIVVALGAIMIRGRTSIVMSGARAIASAWPKAGKIIHPVINAAEKALPAATSAVNKPLSGSKIAATLRKAGAGAGRIVTTTALGVSAVHDVTSDGGWMQMAQLTKHVSDYGRLVGLANADGNYSSINPRSLVFSKRHLLALVATEMATQTPLLSPQIYGGTLSLQGVDIDHLMRFCDYLDQLASAMDSYPDMWLATTMFISLRRSFPGGKQLAAVSSYFNLID